MARRLLFPADMKNACRCVALAVTLFGCGSNPAGPVDASAPGDAAPATASSDGGAFDATSPLPTADAAVDAGADVVEDGGAYPAFRPPVPVIQSGGGPVLTAPTIVPVFFAGTAQVAALTDYVSKAVASSEWTTQLAEYGVGRGTAAPAVTADPLPSTNVTQADLESYIADQITAGAWGAVDTQAFGTRLYVLFLEATDSISLPSGKTTCNGGPNGFHNEALVGATHVPYAVVADCGHGLAGVTRTAWHEMGEGCTDPYAAPNRAYFKAGAAWSIAFSGGETGDMCEHRSDATMTPPDIGYAIQRMWSNASAQAYHDPCIPVPAGETYVAAAPVLPDMVTLGGASVAGVTVPVGSQKTIDVQLFSDGPTPGPFQVVARESQQATNLSFTWDRTQGKNGEVLHLTIEATTATPQGTTFVIASALGSTTSQWVVAVGN